MTEIAYCIMSGAGNLFAVVDGRELPDDTDEQALGRTLCARSDAHGVVDGLLVVTPDPQTDTDFVMRYYNRDGSTGMMCGNGGRCALQFAIERQMVTDPHQARFTNAGIGYTGTVTDRGCLVRFPDPRSFKLRFKIPLLGDMRTCHYADVGTPHAVLFVDELHVQGLVHVADLDLQEWGPPVRHYHEFGVAGANANFVEVLPDGSGISIRTFERGVEGETGACGTGAISSAIIASALRHLKPPVAVGVPSGKTLWVDFRVVENHVVDVSLEGDAETIGRFSAEI